MNEADMGTGTPPPPGSTAVRPDPAEHRHDEQSTGSPRAGIDTDNLRDYRALRRDRHDRKIAGVSGGLARHLDIDPTLVRVVMVVLVLFGGAGLILYAALWLFVPEEGSESALIPVGESTRNIIVVVALAVALLIALPSGVDGDAGAFVGLLILGGIVAAVLLTRDSARRRSAGSAPPPPGTGGGGDLGSTAVGAPAWSSSVTIPPPPGSPGATYGYTPKPTRRGPLLFGMALASLALALGVLGIFDANGEAVPDAAYPALALAVIGAWLVVGAFFGRPGGLVLLGVLALIGLSIGQIAEPRFEGDRELVRRPVQASQLADHYDVPAGRAEVDLTAIRDLEELDGRTLRVDLNAGEIQLVVPDDLSVDLDAEVGGGGEITTPNGTRNGWGVEVQESIVAAEPRATLDVDLGVGFGRILVRSE